MHGNDHSIESQTLSSVRHTITNGATYADICAKPATNHQTTAEHAKENEKSAKSSTNDKKGGRLKKLENLEVSRQP